VLSTGKVFIFLNLKNTFLLKKYISKQLSEKSFGIIKNILQKVIVFERHWRQDSLPSQKYYLNATIWHQFE